MKPLQEFFEEQLDNSINESSEGCTPEMLTMVQDKLPELENLIRSALGCKSNEKIGLHAEMGRNNKISIYSDDILYMLGTTLVHTLFKEICIDFWGGSYSPKHEKIWFNPNISYKHPGGGSNGTDFIWNNVWFDPKTQEWEVGRKIF